MRRYAGSRPLWVGAAAVFPRNAALERRFIWTDANDVAYEAHRCDDKHVYIPREAVPMDGCEDRRAEGVPITVDLKYAPRDADQERVREEVLTLLEDERSHIAECSTGWGKTWLASAAIAHMGVKALVICTQQNLMDQWRRELKKFLGLEANQVGIMQQSRCDVAGKPVVLGMLHSLAKDDGRWRPQVMQQFGLVIVDEVHRLAADQFNTAMYQLPGLLRLGLSADSNRKDGRYRLIKAHMGPVMVEAKQVPMPPKILRYRTRWRVPRRGGEQIPHSAKKNAHVEKILTRNERRNKLIGHTIQRLYRNGRTIVVFSNRLEHLAALRHAATREYGVKGLDCSNYVGGMNEEQLEEAARARVIFATYQMAGTGVNYPWWDACILATPRGDPKQPVGRVCRKAEDKRTPIVIDLWDDDSPVYEGFGYGRQHFYESAECKGKIVDLDLPEEFC